QKVLEDANIKLASVATDTLGASGRAMLEAIVKGEQDSQRLAEMSRGLLRNKIPELQQALEGRVTGHHRFLLRELLDHLYFVESKMRRIEQEVEERLGPFQSAVAHNLLVIAYYILRDGTCYRDLGPDYFDRLNPEGLRRRLTKRLEGLGFKVSLEPLAQVV